ncbi:MAG: hypothetical protein RXR31_03050 [Thermoproteota archaeon]
MHSPLKKKKLLKKKLIAIYIEMSKPNKCNTRKEWFMAYIIKCGACGFKFFNDSEDAIAPNDILRRYAYICPSCFKRLEYTTNRVSIRREDISILEKRLRLIRIKKMNKLKGKVFINSSLYDEK